MYNEEPSIPSLRGMFAGQLYLPPDCDHRIIIVNDGSNDKTPSLIARWADEDNQVTVLTHERNMGLGEAILTGFREAIKMDCTCIVTIDADASHPVKVINDLINAILSGADIAIASRFAEGGGQKGVSASRRFLSFGARILLSTVFPLKGVRDYTTGFRAYRTALVKKALGLRDYPFLICDTFAATAELLLKMATQAHEITEIPLLLRYDLKESSSKLKLFPTIFEYLKLCRMTKENCFLGKGISI
jgi:dolichol-phosphate mannosyltransferase